MLLETSCQKQNKLLALSAQMHMDTQDYAYVRSLEKESDPVSEAVNLNNMWEDWQAGG